jgi:hypothetical protein
MTHSGRTRYDQLARDINEQTMFKHAGTRVQQLREGDTIGDLRPRARL